MAMMCGLHDGSSRYKKSWIACLVPVVLEIPFMKIA